jgi:ABC-2 type transport system permease protein
VSSTVVNPRPDVVGNDLRRVVALTWTLATTEFKLRFYGSVLGYTWTLVRPFALFGVLYVVFALIVKVGAGIKHYPAYILLAMVLFQFTAGIVSTALTSLVNREQMLRKMRFPYVVIPLAVILQSCFDLAMTLAAVSIFIIALGVYPTWSWFELFPLVGVLILFASGLGLLLSVLYVRYRDMAPIWDVVSQMLFYASPVLYVATQVPAEWQRPVLANPIGAVLTEVRHAVIDPAAPSAAEAIGGAERLLIPAGIVLFVFVLGVWAFQREAPRVAENL